MSNWTVYKYSSGSWIEDGTLPRPQSDLDDSIETTSEVSMLEDGSKIRIEKEVKYNKPDITFEWFADDYTIWEKISEYIQNGDYIKIVTHLSAIEFIGDFSNLSPKWLVGKSPDEWNVQATFRRF